MSRSLKWQTPAGKPEKVSRRAAEKSINSRFRREFEDYDRRNWRSVARQIVQEINGGRENDA